MRSVGCDAELRQSAFVEYFSLLLCPGGALTRVEKKRLQVAVNAQRGAPLLMVRAWVIH